MNSSYTQLFKWWRRERILSSPPYRSLEFIFSSPLIAFRGVHSSNWVLLILINVLNVSIVKWCIWASDEKRCGQNECVRMRAICVISFLNGSFSSGFQLIVCLRMVDGFIQSVRVKSIPFALAHSTVKNANGEKKGEENKVCVNENNHLRANFCSSPSVHYAFYSILVRWRKKCDQFIR